jgi:hypothetical protein
MGKLGRVKGNRSSNAGNEAKVSRQLTVSQVCSVFTL